MSCHPPRVSVIVPTRNRAGLLGELLRRLAAQTFDPASFEVLVIDDGSTDETAAVVEASSLPRLTLHRLPHSGRAAARNAALRLAAGEILVFLDDDAMVEPDFLAAHAAVHRRLPAAMVTGPIVEVEAVPAKPWRGPWWRGYHRNPLPTGNASVRRQHVAAVGGFDERFGRYGWEDTDLAIRLRRAGLVRRFAWRARILHVKTWHARLDLGQRVALEQDRGAMGALLYATHPSLGVALMTKMWRPIRVLDRVLARLLGLDVRLDAVRRGVDPGHLLPLTRLILLYHAEIEAGRRALMSRPATGGPDAGALPTWRRSRG